MRVSNFLKLLVSSLFLMGLVLTTEAQIAPRYGLTYSSFYDSVDDGSIIDTITLGDTLPYFVMPDPVLNNGFAAEYNPANDNATNNLNSTWTWWMANGNLDSILQYAVGEETGPYIYISSNATGVDTIRVQEVSASGCLGDTSWLPVVIVDQPDFVVGNAIADTLIRICEGSEAQNVILASIADNGVAGGTLKFQVDVTVDNLNGDESFNANHRTSTDSIVNLSEANLGGTDVTILAYSIALANNMVTRYTFTFDGMNDHISRKSDFLRLTDKTGATDSEYTYYAESGTFGNQIKYIIYPAPNTGRIYFIPNDFNR